MSHRRHFHGALLSSVVPGTGQWILGSSIKAALFLGLFFLLILGFWPARWLRVYAGFGFLFLGWATLFVYATLDALVSCRGKFSSRPSKWWILLFLPIALATSDLTGIAIVRASGFRSFSVPSTSMEPTIHQWDSIIVDTHTFHENEPNRSDIAVFRKDNMFVVKRIMAIPGDTIEGRERVIFINGKKLQEDYIEHTFEPGNNPALDTFGPLTVSSGMYFVMGDNRDVSLDSRYPGYGLIERNNLIGKPLYIFRPSSDRAGKMLR